MFWRLGSSLFTSLLHPIGEFLDNFPFPQSLGILVEVSNLQEGELMVLTVGKGPLEVFYAKLTSEFSDPLRATPQKV